MPAPSTNGGDCVDGPNIAGTYILGFQQFPQFRWWANPTDQDCWWAGQFTPINACNDCGNIAGQPVDIIVRYSTDGVHINFTWPLFSFSVRSYNTPNAVKTNSIWLDDNNCSDPGGLTVTDPFVTLCFNGAVAVWYWTTGDQFTLGP